VEGELAALAASGATSLVGLMVTDMWSQVRTRTAALFARRRTGQAELVEAELEQSRVELLTATEHGDQQTVEEVKVEWRRRLRRLLASDPQVGAQLRALLDEFDPQASQSHGGHHIEFRGNTIRGPVQGSGIQNNYR